MAITAAPASATRTAELRIDGKRLWNSLMELAKIGATLAAAAANVGVPGLAGAADWSDSEKANVKAVNDPATFDWGQMGNTARHVIEPLVRIDSANRARPHLAESWQASPDLKTWTFKLRQGVKWSNGDTFGADDVIFNINRWLDPKTGSSNMGRFSSMVTATDTGKKDDKGKPIISRSMTPGAVEKIDDRTVRFLQTDPAPGQHRLAMGASLRVGQRVFERGTILRPIEIGILAEIGHVAVFVQPRPKVAVLPTGNELVAANEQPAGGQIRNSNGPMLAAAVQQERLARLQALIDRQQSTFNAATVGKKLPVLFDRQGRRHGQIVGKTPYLQSVHAQGPTLLIGTLSTVEIVDRQRNSLGGVIIGP